MATGPRILVRGEGIAAACCAHLLRRAGLAVAVERVARPPVPAILLSDQALGLMRDVFDRPALLAGSPRIDRRIVAWGDRAEAAAVPHGGVVVSEAELLAELPIGDAAPGTVPPHFTIHTAAVPSSETPMRFGSRSATAAPVQLLDPADRSSCFIESVDEGWLFLIPNRAEQTWLLAIGAPLKRLLARSRVISPRLAVVGAGRSGIDSCPRIAPAIAGADWLACGTAALAFDPICGDGTAWAIREAILATGVVVAIAEGGDAEALRGHYAAMLVATMRRHLALCADFYASGGAGPWWQAELAALVEGHRWCTAMLSREPEPRYQLDGFRLVPRKMVA
jgi:hypothetical protein